MSETALVPADLLHNILFAGLARHINDHVRVRKKINHWRLEWAAENTARMAAIAVVFDRAKDDLRLPHKMKSLPPSTRSSATPATIEAPILTPTMLGSGMETDGFGERRRRAKGAQNRLSLDRLTADPSTIDPRPR